MLGVEYEQIPSGSWNPGEAEMQMFMGSQEIPFPLKLIIKRRLAQKEAASTGEKYRAKEREIEAKTKSAYYELFLAHQKVKINQENKELLEQLSRIAQTKYVTGKASQSDFLKAQVELSKITNELLTSEQEKEVAEAMLRSILSRSLDQPLGIPQEPTRIKFDRNLEDLNSLALETRPEILGMFKEIEAAKTSSLLMKMEYLPDFRIKYEQLHSEGKSLGKNIAFEANFPLWFGKQSSGVRETKAMVRMKEAELMAMKNMTLAEIRELWTKVKSKERLVNLYETNILPLMEQNLKVATIGYETGKVDFIDLLDSQRMLRELRLEYFEAMVDFENSIAELERVVGRDLRP